MNLLMSERCYALIGAIIRMELDSYTRLYDFKRKSFYQKKMLLNNFFGGREWPRSWPTQDWKLVAKLSENIGWAHHIYKFCCAFIHLSPYHDWASNNDIPHLTADIRQSIVQDIGMQNYDPLLTITEDFGFEELIPFAPHILKKLRDNMKYEME